MIKRIPFGKTGHDSSRLIFGAAALGGMRQEKADSTLDLVMQAGINHIDVAASYGQAEDRLQPFLQDYRQQVFLATKTHDRDADGARASIERSLSRMGVEQIDLIQFHNLATDEEWASVMGTGGALEAASKARDEGLVRFIGVTGHGTRIAEMHLKSLDAFDFASVLLPYSHTMMQEPIYAEEFEQLYQLCNKKGVAMQTIKSIARRRWREDDPSPRFSWYEPWRDPEVIERAVQFVLAREGLFLNTSSDATLLPALVAAAESFEAIQQEGGVDAKELETRVAADVKQTEAEPLFVRGFQDGV